MAVPFQVADRHACCLQMMFTCVSMVMSLTIFAYILGEISNLVMDQDAELVKTRSQVYLVSHLPHAAMTVVRLCFARAATVLMLWCLV